MGDPVSAACAVPTAARPEFPTAAMAQTDINGDGRVDIVLAYSPNGDGNATQAVYLNTGRGYQAASPINYGLPAGVALAHNTLYPGEVAPSVAGWPRVGFGDMARFVDLDNDGLVDIVKGGLCNRNSGGQVICNAAQWYRNQGDLPDRMVRVDGADGAWTTVEYASPKSTTVRLTAEGIRPPATMRVVKTIRSAAGPLSPPAGQDSFPIQETRLSYDNFVRDPLSNEVLGFEKVTAELVNSFNGQVRETVKVTRTFDVRPSLLDANGVLLPVRHPLKGALVSTVTESGGWFATEREEYEVTPLGTGVRVRPRLSVHEDLSPSAVAAASAEETLSFDAYGNALSTRSGDFDGVQVIPDNVSRTTGYEYLNRTTGAGKEWQIGLVTRQQTQGYSEDIDGAADTAHVLSDVKTTYTPQGSVATTRRMAIRHAACAGADDDLTRFDYGALGLLTATHEAAGPNESSTRDVTFTYEPKNLYVATAQTKVGRMSGGVFVALATTLTVSMQTDLRHGKTTSTTDPNGAVSTATFDSSGRTLTRTGPDSTVLEQNVYVDSFPVSVTSTITTDTGKTYQRKTHLDAEGHARSVVEGAGTTAVPWSRKSKTRFDAFGRAVETYLPALVSTIDGGLAAATGPKEVATYDGFDRATQMTSADGRVTSTAYQPRETTETNARGIPTRRTYDVFGGLLAVDRNPGGTDSSQHSFVRDGRGEILSVTDGDGHVRRIERDGGGRLRKVTLPTTPGEPTTTFSMCHDVQDKLVHLESPAGRTVDVMYDELGRSLRSTGTDANGLTVQTSQTYDKKPDGTAAAFGLGRLTAKNDESGVYALTYDNYGRPKTLSLAPSVRAKAGATTVAASYGATFVYAPAGALKTVTFSGVPTATATGLAYTRDVKGRPTSIDAKSGTTASPVTTGLAASVTYDAGDRVTSARYGNGTLGEWTFNVQTERLDRIAYKTAANAVLAAVSHVYDPTDNLLEEKREKLGTAGIFSQKVHTYDALDRLRQTDATSPAGNTSEAYSFSPSGNIMTAGDETYTYLAGASSQAVSVVVNGVTGSSRTLAYDADGYLGTDTHTEADGATSTRTLAFDPMGCMRSITREDLSAEGTSSTAASEYTCGLDGRVVARDTTKSDGSRARRIDFAGLAEIRPDEGVFMLRVPLMGAVTVEDARSLSNGARVNAMSGYLVNDARGSVLATTGFLSSAPGVTREAEYDAWGKKVGGYSAMSAPRHGFAGAEADEAVGTYSFGARSYDPTLRRWVSPDPLLAALPSLDASLGDNLNLYAYVGNNPVRRIDLSGFEGEGFLERVKSLASGFARGVTEASVPGGMAVAAVTPRSPNNDAALGRAAGHAIGGAVAVVGGLSTLAAGGSIEVASGGTATVAVAAVSTLAVGQVINGTVAMAAGTEGLLAARGSGPSGRDAPASSGSEAPAPDAPSTAAPKPGSAGGPGAGKRFSEATRDEAEKQAGGKCVFCGKQTTREPGPARRNTDHAVAKSRDGNNTIENAQNTCQNCNLSKGAKNTQEFLRAQQQKK